MDPALLTVPASARTGVWLVVHFHVDPQRSDAARSLFSRHVADGRTDAGNLVFFGMQHAENPGRFTTVEAWADRASIDAHDATDHHARFLAALADLQTKEKTVETYHHLPAADLGD